MSILHSAFFSRSAALILALAGFQAQAVNLSSLNGTNGFSVLGQADGDLNGFSVATADLNNDGLDDLVLGAAQHAPDAARPFAGRVYVIFGRPPGSPIPGNFDLNSLNGSNGFAINGEVNTDGLGFAVSYAGDINGDGIDDIALGAPRPIFLDPPLFGNGKVYVIFGRTTAFPSLLELNTLNGANGFRVTANGTGAGLGVSVSTAGRVNSDAVDDLAIGAPSDGDVYIIGGRTTPFPASLDVADLTSQTGARYTASAAHDRFGASVTILGDISGDGRDDIAIGAPGSGSGTESGEVYVVYGIGGFLNRDFSATSLFGYRVIGASPGDLFGLSVSGGDLNGDGRPDLVVGAPAADDTSSNSGSVYVLYGGAVTIGNTFNVANLTGPNGFTLMGGHVNGAVGTSVNAQGDFNDDGIADVLLGAPRAGLTGAAYVVHGQNPATLVSLDLRDVDGTNGLVIPGTTALYTTGGAVHSGGDMNGDGADDVIIGAPMVDGSRRGIGYVVYGENIPRADLAVTVTDGVDALAETQMVTYAVTATNFGPEAVSGATVEMLLSPELDVSAASWTCSGNLGGVCGTPSGTGSVSLSADLPVNGQVVVELSTIVTGSNGNVVTQVAEIGFPGPINDSNPGNNIVADIDIIGGSSSPFTGFETYIKPDAMDSNDTFGGSVAVSGDTLVVGMRGDMSNATGVDGDSSDNSLTVAGGAYVFVRSGATWQRQAYLKPLVVDDQDDFGFSVAISGDTVVIGAPGEDSDAAGVNGDATNNSNLGSGAAYVFVRNGTTWSQQAYLKAGDAPSVNITGSNDQFGWSVAVDADTVVVGALREDSNATGVNGDPNNNDAFHSGAAYVFVRNGSTWSQQAYLKAHNTHSGANFGSSVGVDGNTVVVGAERESGILNVSGAAYVFVRNGSSWSQQAYLKAFNVDSNDNFGRSVAVSGDVVAVGAGSERSSNGDPADNTAIAAGAVYIYARTANQWSHEAYLKASNVQEGDEFGASLDLENNTLIVGAAFEDSGATDVGGNRLDNSTPSSGAAYVFTRSVTTWVERAYLKPSNTDADDRFGSAVGLSTNGAISSFVVGSVREESNATGINGDQADNSLARAGAVYVYGAPTYRIGGTVTGLAPGSQLIAQNSGGDDLVIAGNGSFEFARRQNESTGYQVTIATQPTGPSQTCTVANGIGTVGTLDVGSVEISCVINQFQVGGQVTGLQGTGLVLQNSAGDNLAIGGNGSFLFPTAIDDFMSYDVTVLSQPTQLSQTCTVVNGIGTLDGADVASVSVECVNNLFSIGGTVSGLTGSGLVLRNNDGDDLAIATNGSFEFNTGLAQSSLYQVSVLSQPDGPSQTCDVVGGVGVVGAGPVTTIAINCSTDSFSIGGSVSGLQGTGLVLQNNGGDSLSISNNGVFSFPTPLEDLTQYTVAVAGQPTQLSQTCAVTDGSGTLAGSDVSSVQVTCQTNAFSVGGVVTGLLGSGLILRNNGTDDLLLATNGPFTFDTLLEDGMPFDITVASHPSNPGQGCGVSGGSGALTGEPVTSVEIVCGFSADLAVTISNNAAVLEELTEVTYSIRVENLSNVDVMGAQVTSILPPELDAGLATWSCEPGPGAVCSPSGVGNVGDSVDLPGGSEVTYALSTSLLRSTSPFITTGASVTPPVTPADINLLNNTDADNDPVALFVDGLESKMPSAR